MLPSSSVFRFWMVSDGAAARRAWGVAVVQTGGSDLVEGVRKGCSALSLSREGALYSALSSSAGAGPPRCSTDPASPTAALQKGLCWGVCRLYPGLRGCVMWKRRRRG